MQNFYGVYLTSDGTTIRFPVDPREYSIEYPTSNERYNVLSLGEIVQPRTPGLRKISWDEGLLPGRPDGPYVLTSGAFEPPEFYIEFLQSCQMDKKVCTLAIDRRYEDGTPYQSDSFPVIVEGFTVTERGAETGDFYYSITLTEHQEYAPQRSHAAALARRRGHGSHAAAEDRAEESARCRLAGKGQRRILLRQLWRKASRGRKRPDSRCRAASGISRQGIPDSPEDGIRRSAGLVCEGCGDGAIGRRA